MHTIGTPLMWVAFTVVVIIALAVDLLMMRSKGPHKVETREALLWSAGWIALALVFNAGLWWYLHDKVGPEEAKHVALQFFTGYLVEKALAVDNIFVFLMLFGYFAVPPVQQQRALIFGIIGAILLRAILSSMVFLSVSPYWLKSVQGVLILVTVLVDILRRRRVNRQ